MSSSQSEAQLNKTKSAQQSNQNQANLSVAAIRYRFGSSEIGKSAFDWNVYSNRKSALEHLRQNCILIDTILETEDGSAYEFVHSQVISAFGEKFNEYINQNGDYVDSYRSSVFHTRARGSGSNGNLSSSNSGKTVISAVESKANAHTRTSAGLCQSASLNRWSERVKLIRLPKVNSYTLGILVDCAYTGYIRTDLLSGGIWQVLNVAEHYEMAEVIRACCAFLLKNLDRSNCVHFYHIGIKHRHHLQRCAWHKIRANFKYILTQNLQRDCLVSAPMELGHSFGPVQKTFNLSQSCKQVNGHERGKSVPITRSMSELDRQQREELEQRRNNIATIKFEHFEPLLMHDKLNIDNEETIWTAIKLWCNYNLAERASKLVDLLPCMRFPRFKTGTDFSTRFIWRDSLIMSNKRAQHQLAILDRNHRDFLANSAFTNFRDGFSLPCATYPRQLRPRVPHSVLLAIGGWQQGQPTTLIESYDINCNLWFESKKKIMLPLAYHGIECINGILYICGGTDGNEILNEVFTFDPVSGLCAQKPSMIENRCYVSTAYLEGKLYAMGGHNGANRMKSVELFRLDREAWEHVQEMNVARSDASACVYKSTIFIAGGLNDQVIENSVEFYNLQDGTWTFVASMITPRTSFVLLLFNERLLAIGGNNGSERLSSVEQYNFVTKLWSHHSNMRHRRSTFSAAVMNDSKLIVVGGYNGQTPFNQVEMFDEQGQTWTLLQKIRFDRSGLKVVVVSDLPNTTEFTFLGSADSMYTGSEDNAPMAASLAEVQPQAASLTARARARLLRSIGAAPSGRQPPQHHQANSRTNQDEQAGGNQDQHRHQGRRR